MASVHAAVAPHAVSIRLYQFLPSRPGDRRTNDNVIVSHARTHARMTLYTGCRPRRRLPLARHRHKHNVMLFLLQ